MVRCGAGAEGLQKNRGEDSSDMQAIYQQFIVTVDMWLLGLSSSTHVRAEDHRSGRVGRGSLRRLCHRPWVA